MDDRHYDAGKFSNMMYNMGEHAYEASIDPEETGRKQEDDEKLRLQELYKKLRPRWPLRDKGVIPDIEGSMKQKIKKLAKDVMSLVGLKGLEIEKQLMTSIAKGLVRDGLKIFQPQKKLLLKNLGRQSLFKVIDKFDTEMNEDDEVEEEPWTGERGEEGGESDIFQDDSEEEEQEDDLLDFLFHPEKYDQYYEKPDEQKEEKVNVVDEEEDIEEENLGYPWRTIRQFFRSEGEGEFEIKDESEGKGEFGSKDELDGEEEEILEKKLGRLTKDIGFEIPQSETPKTGIEQEEEIRRLKRLKRRRICRLTLVTCGNTSRQDMGYMEGWTDSGPELGVGATQAVEEASLALLKRGFKFDMAITSTMSVSKTVVERILFAAGQDSLRRLTTSDLNPRHLGDLEGQTEAGLSSAWGWMLPLYSAYRGAPIMKETHPHWYHQANGEPTEDPDKPKGETVFHVLARTGNLWNAIKDLFIHKEKRSILIVGHKDSIRGLLFHMLALHPTDFSEWQPTPAVPILFAFEKKETNFGLAAVDFITTPEDNRRQIIGLCKAMLESNGCLLPRQNLVQNPESYYNKYLFVRLERHVDKGIIDKYAVKEIKTRMDESRHIPTIEDIYRYKRKEAFNLFEGAAKEVGRQERAMEALEAFYGKKPPETEAKKYMDFILDVKNASFGEKDNMTVEEKIKWIAKNVPGTANKIQQLRKLKTVLPPDSSTDYITKIDELIQSYKQQVRLEKDWLQTQKDEIGQVDSELLKNQEEELSHWKCVVEAVKQGWLEGMPSDVIGNAGQDEEDKSAKQ